MPMYNEAPVIAALRAEVTRFMSDVKCEVEVLLVNDGSTDETLARIADWSAEDPRIKIVHLSRNFGQQFAATAGLDFATGDAIVLIDSDLQDPLPMIHEMIARYMEGYDVAYGQRMARPGEGRFKRLTAWIFYRIMRYLTDWQLPVDAGDFRLLSRQCLDSLKSLRETHRFLRGMVSWVGYPQIAVPYLRAKRMVGETKYPVWKMVAFAWTAATSFSTFPLRISFVLGVIFGLGGLEEAIRAFLAVLLGWSVVPGWRSLMVVTSLLGSAILLSISMLGEYVGKMYEQSKGRPLYLVARTFNIEEGQSKAATAEQSAERWRTLG